MNSKIEHTLRTTLSKRLFPIVVICFLCLVGCNKDDEAIDVNDNPETSQEPVEESKFITRYFLGNPVEVSLEKDGTYSLAGSDTRLFKEQLTDTPDAYEENPEPVIGYSALALSGGIRKWTNSTVVYRISGLSSTVRAELEKSFDEWTSRTNVRFKERTNETNYVTISSSGSNSNSGVATLGMNGSRGFIRLGTRATAVVIIHEIGHTLGYVHEQNRSDRDRYIRINWNNIQDNAVNQFYKSSSANLVTNQFDVNSTMMYGSYTFSKNGRPTITDLNGNLLPRRQARLSTLDVQGTNSIYTMGDGHTGGTPDACDGVEPWSSNKRYVVGDRVTNRGYLFERDFTRWNYIKPCA